MIILLNFDLFINVLKKIVTGEYKKNATGVPINKTKKEKSLLLDTLICISQTHGVKALLMVLKQKKTV